MIVYFIRRVLLIIPTFIGATLLVFLLTRFVPGGPLYFAFTSNQSIIYENALNSETRNAVPYQQIDFDRLNEFFSFNKPWYSAYVEWLSKVISGNLGRSIRYGDLVTEIIQPRIKVSFVFGLLSLVIIYLISIPLGISKALNNRSWFDTISSIVIFILYAIPSYVVAIILFSVFSARLGWFPLGGFQSPEIARQSMNFFEKLLDTGYHIFLPLTAYVMNSFAALTITMKNMLLETISAEYVKAAVAKGRSFKDAVYLHAVKNSLLPLASEFGTMVSAFLSGTFLIEQIFNIRGLGMLGYTALLDRDYPIVMGVLVITILISLIGNILGDLFVSLLDPRIRLGRAYA